MQSGVSKSCPFQHCSLKVDLWLRLQFTFLSLLPLHSWHLYTRHYIATRAEMSFTLLLFHYCIVLYKSSPLSPSLAFPPIYRGDRVIRVWAVVFSPIHFYLCFRGLILQSHFLLSQSTFPPAAGCFWGWGEKKSQLGFLSPRSNVSALPSPCSISAYLMNPSSFWLGHLTTAITLYDFI